jgi:DNA-binding NarL/FixJ family response regulator
MGFTNKEIAVFLNATVRSVESRRYRISKKIELVNKNTTLLKHLQVTFSDTL